LRDNYSIGLAIREIKQKIFWVLIHIVIRLKMTHF